MLAGAAGTYMTSVYLNPEQRRSLRRSRAAFPSVSIFDIDALLKQIRDVGDKASLAVQYVFLFTLVAGITVLFAAIQASRDERRYESAMLRTLGASRRTVLLGVAAEFAALRLLRGVLAALGADPSPAIFSPRGLIQSGVMLDLWVWTVGITLGVLLVGISGTLATRSVVNQPPIATLRQGTGDFYSIARTVNQPTGTRLPRAGTPSITTA